MFAQPNNFTVYSGLFDQPLITSIIKPYLERFLDQTWTSV
jgi:hypothetical protein